jgi:hypothetical protein
LRLLALLGVLVALRVAGMLTHGALMLALPKPYVMIQFDARTQLISERGKRILPVHSVLLTRSAPGPRTYPTGTRLRSTAHRAPNGGRA